MKISNNLLVREMKQLTLTVYSAVASSTSARLSSQNLAFSPVIKSVFLKYCLQNRPIFPLYDIQQLIFLMKAKRLSVLETNKVTPP